MLFHHLPKSFWGIFRGFTEKEAKMHQKALDQLFEVEEENVFNTPQLPKVLKKEQTDEHSANQGRIVEGS